MKIQFCIALVMIFVGSLASARSFTLTQGTGYTVEPLYGYETIYRNTPTPHTQTRAMYGLRLTLGVDLLSLEAEYAKASDTENYAAAPEKVYTEDENYKLGIRSTYRFNQYFFFLGRMGAQATKGFEESTSSGVTTREEKELKYNPYAGAQLGIRFGVFSLSAGSTVIFKDYNDFSKNDFQNTLTFGVGY